MARRRRYAVSDDQLGLDSLWAFDTPDEEDSEQTAEVLRASVVRDHPKTDEVPPAVDVQGPTWRDTLDITGLPHAPRLAANLDALETLNALRDTSGTPDDAQRTALQGWTSWGALPHVFDTTKPQWSAVRTWVQERLTPDELAAARRTTVNAHYTNSRYTDAMWTALTQAGVRPGHIVLEPGCGSGNFLGSAPPGVEMVGVELDPTTADIAQLLHPAAEIRAESFADTRYAPASFDAAVGNVPFGDFALHDPDYNPNNRSIHNHFIAKSVRMLRPGGVAAFITSRYTLDARNPSFREELSAEADLVGAVRLPNAAHERTAGTDVVTDVLLLRKRTAPRDDDHPSWTSTVVDPATGQHLNAYFAQHPEHVLGELTTVSSAYGPTLGVVGHTNDDELAQQLGETLTAIVEAHQPPGESLMGEGAAQPTMLPPRVAQHGVAEEAIGYHRVEGDVIVMRDIEGEWQPVKVPKKHFSEACALLALRDATIAVIERESASRDDTPELDACRTHLAQLYGQYTKDYGPVSRMKIARRTRRDGTVSERFVSSEAYRAVRRDPHITTVLALDSVDQATGKCTPSSILTRRAIAPATPPTRVDTSEEAIAVCMDQHAQVKIDVIADLLGTSTEQVVAELEHQHIFHDPVTNQWETAAAYLSGDVKTKLAYAESSAKSDVRYRKNAQALRAVLPADIGPAEIKLKLGASWIPAEAVQEFLRDTLRDKKIRVDHDGGSSWRITPRRVRTGVAQSLSTQNTNVIPIIEAAMEQKPLVARKTIDAGDGKTKSVVDPEETAAWQNIAEKVNDAFVRWAWSTDRRTEMLVRCYNDKHNRLVLRTYDSSPRDYEGLVRTFDPRPHQHAAVQRIVTEPSVGLFHDVGAGKTAVMSIASHELKRLGLAAKPMIVVPNHMLEQMTREYKDLFPAARVLAAGGDDVAPAERATFVAKCATSDWDAIIMTDSAFSRIPLSSDALKDVAAHDRERLESVAQRAIQSGNESLVKKAEKKIIRAEERSKKTLGKVSEKWVDGTTFDKMGADYLFIDEFHNFKNGAIESSTSFASEGSLRAADMEAKLTWLRAVKGPNARIMTGATATPLANSIAEMWTMQRYLRPDLLEAAGVRDFDAWIGTFGVTTTDLEVKSVGEGFRTVTRIASFTNFPELMKMWSVAGDIKSREDLNLPVPQLAQREDGQRAPEIVSLNATPATTEYVASLVDRAEDVSAGRVEPTLDNMLTVTNDGRAAALDLNLLSHRRYPPAAVDDPADGYRTKLDAVAERIVQIHQETRENTYKEGEKPGGLQIVFCDLGTPNDKGRWSAYDALIGRLTDQGLDAERIRVMQEAKTPSEKNQLFHECRSGDVDVIIGSTSTMGTGTNIQRRAVALHHVDCPWRPCDIEQREGRIIRQGNLNDEVRILRYVTQKTFDAYMWQTVERKAKSLGPVLAGRVTERDVDNFDEAALSFAEVKALGSGNPNILRKAQAEAEVAKWERLASAHEAGQRHLKRQITIDEARIKVVVPRSEAMARTIPRLVDTTGDKFALTVDGTTYRDRSTSEAALRQYVQQSTARVGYRQEDTFERVVSVGGLELDLHINKLASPPQVHFVHGPSQMKAEVHQEDFARSDTNVVSQRLANVARKMPEAHAKYVEELETSRQRVNELKGNVGAPFEHAAKLKAARQEMDNVLGDIQQEMAQEKTTPTPSQDQPVDVFTSAMGVMDQMAAATLAGKPAGAEQAKASPYYVSSTVVSHKAPDIAP